MDDYDIFSKLFLPILLLLDKLEYTTFVIFRLAGQDLFLRCEFIFHQLHFMDVFTQLDSFNFELFLLQVQFAHFTVKFFYLCILCFHLQLSLIKLQ